MSDRPYSYQLRFTDDGGNWEITKRKHAYHSFTDPIIWSMPWKEEHDGQGQPPLEFRQKFEALLAEAGWISKGEPTINIVELATAGSDDCAFDQPCVYGHRVEDHAVYCHNEAWLYSPRKCRRTQGPSVWSNDAWPHEQCPGFKANPLYKPRATTGKDEGE